MSRSTSITLKAIIIVVLTLMMLIPNAMIRELIRERKYRSEETIEKINDKWSHAQTLYGPVLVVPYTTTVTEDDKRVTQHEHELCITPEKLAIETKLFPEERHYGIYKAIVYKSEEVITGNFAGFDFSKLDGSEIHFDKAYIAIGMSDLRGLTGILSTKCNGRSYELEPSGSEANVRLLSFLLGDREALQSGKSLTFDYRFSLNGSSSINYVPLGKTTEVRVSGDWASPSYTGDFSPEILSAQSGFDVKWNILSFNRNIAEYWTDHPGREFSSSSPIFGVYLLDSVDHYQQNDRSAKYASLFIILTFVVFFFVELLTRKKIHPIQYLLVGISLLLFFTLLLSLSEHLHFGWSYLLASVSTVGMITLYSQTIFANRTLTGILGLTLSALYIFLYTVLQLEDIALLIGSIGLFAILAVLMYVSRKVNWYRHDE